MLTQLSISQFAIVDTLRIDFAKGMTAITGETGAGKSIIIDALNLCLGARADAAMIRHGQKRADISAQFILAATADAHAWLEYFQLDEGCECILRRVINQDGRSRAFINGKVVPVSQLRELGQKLVHIHGQYEHQLLLHSDYQQNALDCYMAEPKQLQRMTQVYQEWQTAEDKWQHYKKEQAERSAYKQLLHYQIEELTEFAPVNGEFEQMDEEYKKLNNCEQRINQSQHAASFLSETENYNVLYFLNIVKSDLSELVELDNQLMPIAKSVEEATIQLSEVSRELRQYSDRVEMDPERLVWLENRISKQILLARKYQVLPQQLAQSYQEKVAEYQAYEQEGAKGDWLDKERQRCYDKAVNVAQQLHHMRTAAAKKLSKAITQSMEQLSMPNGQCEIRVEQRPEGLHKSGADRISFVVRTNAGQPLQAIAKVISGGELSRLALAIQILTTQKATMSVLIFDEIDVGISGAVAAQVGHLLRQLGTSTQVFTITHLPQVACYAHAHLFVHKSNQDHQIKTRLQLLNREERVFELARLLAGDSITESAIANAKELLIENNF